MSKYEVQFKGRIVHENISEHDLATMVLDGRISGLESYSPTGRKKWLPVCQMVPVRNDKGEWKIQERSHLRPERTPEAQKSPSQSSDGNVTSPNAPVNIFVNSSTPGSDDKAPTPSQPERGAPATMAIIGIALCAMSIIAGLGLIPPQRYFLATSLTGMGLALLAVLFSAISVQYASRRMLPIAGVVLGMLELLIWAGIIVWKWSNQ